MTIVRNSARSLFACWMAGSAMLVPGGSARAQAAAGPDEPESVMERRRPDWDPVDIRFASFKVNAQAQAKVAYDDNVFASNVDQVSDAVATVGGRLRVVSDWSRHQVGLDASLDMVRGLQRDENDVTPYDVTARTRLDIGPSTVVRASAGYGRGYETRGSFADVVTRGPRLGYNRLQADLGLAQTFNRIKIELSGSFDRYDYMARHENGTTTSQAYRDFRTLRGTATVSYALSPGLAVFGQAGYNDASYPRSRSVRNRDSRGVEVVGGVELGVTRLLRGRVGVGHYRQKYESADFPDIKGLTFIGQLEWNPTRLVTVTGTAHRSIQRSPLIGVAGIRQSVFRLQADYELRRNVIVSGNAGYTVSDFIGGDRTQKDARVGADVRWLVNRHLRFVLETDLQRTTNSGSFDRRFTRKQAAVSVRYVF